MEKYQERMLSEFKELSGKCLKLKTFILSNEEFKKLDSRRQSLMSAQLNAMDVYKNILEERLNIEGINPYKNED